MKDKETTLIICEKLKNLLIRVGGEQKEDFTMPKLTMQPATADLTLKLGACCPAAQVQAYLGHVELSDTAYYLHLTAEMFSLGGVMEKTI